MTILNAGDPAHAAAAGRLRAEPIIWLTTVARSGSRSPYGWTPESFAEDYPHRLWVSPTRARIW